MGVIYTFYLKPEGSPKPYRYAIELKNAQEDCPESLFTPEIRRSMRQKLQRESSCAIGDRHLESIVKTWCQDIREGYRQSELALKLPLLIEENVDRLQETGIADPPPNLRPPEIADIEPQAGILPPLESIYTR